MSAEGAMELTTEQAADALRAMNVVWRGVHVRVGGTHALKGVSGIARSGKLTALMGPSGAGKTTLLSALARRIEFDEGEVQFGGLGWSKALKRRIAFVEQDDIVYGELSVRQSLTFLAKLRLKDTDEAAIKARVDETLQLLRLDGVADSLVGSAMSRGISGGERKRLCIAQELLVDPAVMLLDEPTSGLDSSMAQILVDVLKEISRTRGITIIASIHQPSSQIFHAFDDLYLVANGSTVFSGATSDAADFFAKELKLGVPAEFNPADHFMATCVDGSINDESRAARIKARNAEREHELGSTGAHTGSGSAGGGVARSATLHEDARSRYVKPWTYQLRVLLAREWAIRRSALWDWQQLYLHGGIGVLAGVMWWQLGYDEIDIFSRFTATFAIFIEWVFFTFLGDLFFLPSSEVHLRKELGVGAYRLSAWFVAKSSASLLPYAIWPPLHVTIVYWMTNTNPFVGPFFTVLALIAVTILLFQSLSIFLSTALPAQRVMTAALLLMTAMFLFTGIFIPLEETPLPWIGLLNPLLYLLQAGAVVTMGWGPAYQCNDGVTAPTDFPDICLTGTESIPPERALARYGVWASAELSIGILLLYLVVFRVAAFRFLKQRMTPSNRSGLGACVGAAALGKLRGGRPGAGARSKAPTHGASAAAPATDGASPGQSTFV
mmetsp:Transcript_2975/g.7846  ORF Transcript_2975/g.7846 Transcript_2975/m.7846 type:complete len:667 (-) Transcript_2975:162-2162(-)|eukprot:CAMPEP_0119412950 /NCGR_PEP_ID=MMETSP1335-20130426/5205_1 /TAXON_ID=259385 /ORGANISM="Chrysoculter rhomboideus, Strain RCC1486" /LENGTH=666 /DNA_ID=CAMNT_0007437717 /DNA_START=66 /DNA_END=2066 /DNA_ORIENTATION=+